MTKLFAASLLLVPVASAGVDFALRPAGDAGFVLPLLFWAGMAQGAVALSAAADLSKGRWMRDLKATLLSVAPAMFVFPAVFLLHCRDLGAWSAAAAATDYLEPGPVAMRGTVALLVAAWAGVVYARASLAGSRAAPRLAVVYLLVFAGVQVVLAVDWVMAFEYPWVSTMFGPLFLVSALFLGTVLAAMIAVRRGCPESEREHHCGTLRDTGTLVFGLSLLWAGLFFAQYLTIWYGNLPEEAAFFVERFALPAGVPLFTAALVLSFPVPFLVLMPRRSRVTPALVAVCALSVCAGALAEKLFYLLPSALNFSPLPLLLEFLLLGLPIYLAVLVMLGKEFTLSPGRSASEQGNEFILSPGRSASEQ